MSFIAVQSYLITKIVPKLPKLFCHMTKLNHIMENCAIQRNCAHKFAAIKRN